MSHFLISFLLLLCSLHLYSADQSFSSCLEDKKLVSHEIALKTLYSEKAKIQTIKDNVDLKVVQNHCLVPYINGSAIMNFSYEEIPVNVTKGLWDANDRCICWAPGHAWSRINQIFVIFFDEMRYRLTFLYNVNYMKLSKFHENMLYVFLVDPDIYSNDTIIKLELVNIKTDQTLKRYSMINVEPSGWRIVETACPAYYILYSNTSWKNGNYLFDFESFKPVKKTPVTYIRRCVTNRTGHLIAFFTQFHDDSKIIVCSIDAMETPLFSYDLNKCFINSLVFLNDQTVYFSENHACHKCIEWCVAKVDLTAKKMQQVFNSHDSKLKCFLIAKSSKTNQIAIRRNDFGPWQLLPILELEAPVTSNNN